MKNSIGTKTLSLLLSLAMLLSLMPMGLTAYAATTWSSNQNLSSSKTYSEEIIVSQSITLTLNGCDVNANAGIYVQSGTLTVTGTGKLYVQGLRASTNTMGNGIKGNVIVDGARMDVYAADGGTGVLGNLEVRGGDASVNVYGGYGGNPQSSGVGTGGGRGVSGNVTLNGGSLYVEGGSGGDAAYGEGSKKGGSGGAGIGGNVTIRGGGYVHAVGGSGGMGTGGYGGGGLGHYGIVGTLTATSGQAMVIGGDGGDGYTSSGPNAACYGAITAGVRKESSTGGSWTNISGDTSTLQYVKVEGHAHNFTYSADGATITAICSAEECTLPDCTATLTINAPTGSLVANGNVKAATITGSIPEVATPAITYTKDGTAVEASQVKEAGDYVASITLGDAVASVAFTISPSYYIVTIPAKLNVQTGYNATSGITASGGIDPETKVVVTASSANGWKLKNDSNSVSYYLTTAEGGESTTKWQFYADELETGKTLPLGAVVEDYSRKPAGDYADTVTFTAKTESIYTTITWGGPELNRMQDGTTSFTKNGVTVTCGSIEKVDSRAGLAGGGTFTTSFGKIIGIEIYCNPWSYYQPGIIDGTNWVLTDSYISELTQHLTRYRINWEGTPATSVAYNNGFLMESTNNNDYIKVTVNERL